MGRRIIDTDEYNSLDFDHCERMEGGRILMDANDQEVGRLYYDTTITNSLESGTLELED